MNPRRVARELALLTLFQVEKQGQSATELDKLLRDRKLMQDLILSSVRTLVEEAQDRIQTAAEQLADASRRILEMEQEHPINLETPLDAEVKPVPLPTTREVVDRIESCLLGAEYLSEAFRVPEFALLAGTEDVQNYTVRILRLVLRHQEDIDAMLNRYAEDWRVDRLVKMDRFILRIAAAEMKYIREIDLGISINEAVELAKMFSTAESFRFINGLLGKLADVLEAGTEPSGAPETVSEENPSHV